MTKLSLDVSSAEKRCLNQVINALRTPCSVQLNKGNDTYASKAFEEEFRSKILFHHLIIGSPLFQESFDAAFISACRRSGKTTAEAGSGQRFWDVVVDSRKLSLKSTKAKSLKPNTLHISKLCEAAWIQDCRTAKSRQLKTRELFAEYIASVNAIIQLRYFETGKRYELVEIPVSLFQPVLSVGLAHFSSDGPTINIPIGQETPDFTLKIDRSDSKITLANINIAKCIVHGIWQLDS